MFELPDNVFTNVEMPIRKSQKKVFCSKCLHYVNSEYRESKICSHSLNVLCKDTYRRTTMQYLKTPDVINVDNACSWYYSDKKMCLVVGMGTITAIGFLAGGIVWIVSYLVK